MLLKDYLADSGRYFFRWRSYLPLVMVSLFLVGITNFDYIFRSHAADQVYDLLCLGIALLGLAMRVLTVGFVPRGTSGRNTKAIKAYTLNTTGVYSVVRHPLYVSNFVIWLGTLLFLHIWWVVVIGVLAYWLYYERIILAEEEFLLETFGSEYQSWADRVPAVWPRLSSWVKPELPFSTRTALRREHTTFFAIVVVFMALEMAGHFVVSGNIMIEPLWGVLFITGLVLYVTTRAIKKHSCMLEVSGR